MVAHKYNILKSILIYTFESLNLGAVPKKKTSAKEVMFSPQLVCLSDGQFKIYWMYFYETWQVQRAWGEDPGSYGPILHSSCSGQSGKKIFQTAQLHRLLTEITIRLLKIIHRMCCEQFHVGTTIFLPNYIASPHRGKLC